MEHVLKELSLSCHRMQAIQACRNLIGKFSFYNASVLRKKMVGMFADNDAVCLEAPWGVYMGHSGVERRYVHEHGDISDPEAREKFRGNTVIHGVDTEILEVAADGLSARGCWLSPGADFSTGSDGQGASAFCWIKISADFVFEHGEWKIQRYAFYPLHKMPTGQDWSTPFYMDFAVIYPNAHPDYVQDPGFWQYGEPYPFNEPELPLPYESLEPKFLKSKTVREDGYERN